MNGLQAECVQQSASGVAAKSRFFWIRIQKNLDSGCFRDLSMVISRKPSALYKIMAQGDSPRLLALHNKWLRWTFPAFSRRGGCAINKKVPFLSGADGAVSNLYKIMCAARFLDNRPALE